MSEGKRLETPQRQSNMELLRIIAMLLIVAHHFCVHGGYTPQSLNIGPCLLWMQFLQTAGKFGVNIFVLISGYFLINSNNIKISKVIKLWLQVFTYSISIYIIFIILGGAQLNIEEIKESVFPIIFSNWGFASTYLVLYLLSPFINKLLCNIDKKTYQKLLIIMTILWCIIPTFFDTRNQGNDFTWFVYLYSLSGYVRLYGRDIKISNKKFFGLALLTIELILLFSLLVDLAAIKNNSIFGLTVYFNEIFKLPMLLIAVFIFLGFLKTDIKYNKTINLIASVTFGVYLIHDNKYIRYFLWQSAFRNAVISDTIFMIPYSIIVVIIVFSLCAAIELFRAKVIEKRYMSIVDRLIEKSKKTRSQ